MFDPFSLFPFDFTGPQHSGPVLSCYLPTHCKQRTKKRYRKQLPARVRRARARR
jgi:hypothetical protein